MYTDVHKAIRADPSKKRDAKELGNYKTRDKPKDDKAKVEPKRFKRRKLATAQKKARVHQKLASAIKKKQAKA